MMLSPDELNFGEEGRLYRQEGKLSLFPIMRPFLTIRGKMQKYLPVDYGESVGYLKNHYGYIIFYQDSLKAITGAFLEKSKNGFPLDWQEKWKEIDKNVTDFSRKIKDADLESLSLEELRSLYDQMFALDESMWTISIFIDAFDAGYDQEEIEKINKKYNFNFEETQVLLNPDSPSYINAFEQSLFEVKTSKIAIQELTDRFFWYKTNYFSFSELNTGILKQEISEAKKVNFESPIEKQTVIIKNHGIDKNPMEIFKILTTWRDDRKRLNFTSLYSLLKILREVLHRQNIPADLSLGLLPDQVSLLFQGKISKTLLETQLEEGILLYTTVEGKYLYYSGEKKEIIWKEVSSRLEIQDSKELSDSVKGMVACKGKATGPAHIIFDVNSPEASLMKKGGVLVSSMTRPEFLPLMKLASAIVTDEGGISCHAAIVARELNLPCIIGTRNATKIIKNGDLVEVDANHGVVNIIKQ